MTGTEQASAEASEAALLATLASDREYVVIASDAPSSDDHEAMRDFAAFLNQAARVGRELATSFTTSDGKLAIVMKRRSTLVATASGPQLPFSG
jgi:hypothetical protein